MRLELISKEQLAAQQHYQQQAPQLNYQHPSMNPLGIEVDDRNEQPESQQPIIRSVGGKVGRNDACPCGSGKKYKQCHGQL